MKIGLAHNLFDQYAKGGAEKAVSSMAEKFLSEGHEVFLITTEPLSKKKRSAENNRSALKIYYLPSLYQDLSETWMPLRLFWHSTNLFNPTRKTKLKKILSQEQPDIFITHNLVGIGFFLAKIIHHFGIRHEHFLHDIQLLHPSGLMMSGKEKMISTLPAQLYQYATRYFFRRVGKIISPSKWLLEEHLKKSFFKNAETEIRPLRNIANTRERTKDEQAKKAGNFLFVGQIEKHKGILFLIDSFLAVKQDQHVQLRIIGSGADFKEAKIAAKNDKRISFLGYADSETIRNEMKKSGALIVPSLCYENSPTVIYEANEIGLPVLASNIGGIPEITTEKSLLFEAGNKKDLLEKIMMLS